MTAALDFVAGDMRGSVSVASALPPLLGVYWHVQLVRGTLQAAATSSARAPPSLQWARQAIAALASLFLSRVSRLVGSATGGHDDLSRLAAST